MDRKVGKVRRLAFTSIAALVLACGGGDPPPWLGQRVLARTASGFGEVRPTPPELVQRRFTLPDRLPAIPGSGFASRVTAPAPAAVMARSTWQQGCPVERSDLSWVRLTFRGFRRCPAPVSCW